jgi:hypothetical protein
MFLDAPAFRQDQPLSDESGHGLDSIQCPTSSPIHLGQRSQDS